MSFNEIMIYGHLGRDPELRYTPAGDAVCSFSMATSRKRGGEEQTTWFKVTLWRRQAELAAQYLEKGSAVFIRGSMAIDEWTDRDGNNRYTVTVDGERMQFISGGTAPHGGEREESPDRSFAPRETQESVELLYSGSPPKNDDDDIPF